MNGKNKIFHTTTAGLIGYYMVKTFPERGFDVVGLFKNSGYFRVNLEFYRFDEYGIYQEDLEKSQKMVKSISNDGYRFIRMNLEDSQDLFFLLENEKYVKVVNLAMRVGVLYGLENPYYDDVSNVVWFIKTIKEYRYEDVKHLVFSSSSSVFGYNIKKKISNPTACIIPCASMLTPRK